MPQSTSNVVNNGTTQGTINPATVGNSLGQSLGQDLWKGTGALLTGGANFVGGLFNNKVTNPTPALAATNNPSTYAFNGQSYNAAGDPSTAPVTSAANYSPTTGTVNTGTTAPQSVYSQNLAKYGLTSIPTGYSFNAQGVLQNGAGQEYQTPSSAPSGGTTQGTIPAPTGVNSPIPSATYPGIVGTLANTASQPSSQFTTAENNANQAQAELQSLENAQAQGDEQIGGSRTNVSEAQGEAGNYNTYMTGQENAAAQALTGYQTQATAATGQQGTQQSGLSSAGALAAPQSANALGTYNPQTGQYEGYGGGSTGSGAASAGAVGTQIQQGAAVQSMTGQLAQATSLSSNLSSVISAAGYNPADIGAATSFANGVNQWLQNQSGNPQYQNAANLISEISAKYAAILQQAGGTPTSQSQVQQQIINGLSSGQQIETIIGNLQQNAQASINALNTASQSNATNSNGTTGNTNSGGTIFATSY